MKIRYIFITIILGYLFLFIGSLLVELVILDNTSRDVQLTVKTAAQMALQQTQATDEFFVTGGGYLGKDNGGEDEFKLKLLNGDGSAYIEGNIYQAYANSTDIGEIYKKVYNAKDMDSFASNESISQICFLGSVFKDNNFTREWVAIPTLSQLGLNTFESFSIEGLCRNIDNGSIKTLESAEYTQIKKSYVLNNAGKRAEVNGKTITYYNTPISLGITYINKDILAANFVQNMDMLMRSKYGTDIKKGEGVCTTNYYADLVDTSIDKELNPINNGAFTFFRGKKLSGVNSKYSLYDGVKKPEITYYVVDLYNKDADNSKQNSLIQRVVGYKVGDKTTTGKVLKDVNISAINSYKGMTGAIGDNTLFDHKYCVVAKVDFYARIAIPYRTPLLRELRGRVDKEGKVSDRTLFSAFKQDYDTLSGAGGLMEMDTGEDYYTYTTYFAILP